MHVFCFALYSLSQWQEAPDRVVVGSPNENCAISSLGCEGGPGGGDTLHIEEASDVARVAAIGRRTPSDHASARLLSRKGICSGLDAFNTL